MAKIAAGLLSHSVAISADGFNNLSDAGTSLVSLLGFKIAGYGGGSTHPFGHGRIEWIMGIFASIAVLLMGIKLAGTSAEAVTHFAIDGYCGVLVSVFIIFAGVKSLWEVLGRIMGKSADNQIVS